MDLTLTLAHIAALLLAYFAGSAPCAIWVCHWYQLPDPLKHGSGNPGATNVFRLGGKQPGALCLLLDAIKGALPLLFAQWLSLGLISQILVASAAVLGHMYPFYNARHGGKGIATTLGAGLALAPIVTSLLTLIWCLTVWRFRISAVASLTTASLAPFIAYWFDPSLGLFFSVLAILIILRHRSNIQQLIQQQKLRNL